jgi:hypothetical protein
MDTHGEPIGRGQLDRRATEGLALRDAAYAIAVFTGIALVNGILTILLIELLQIIGWWEVPASEGAREVATGLSHRMGVDAAFAE